MTRPWQTIESRPTRDGLFELRRRGADDFLVCLDGRILMNSRESRSEEALGAWTARAVSQLPAPRLLVAGLGMGISLRAALDALPDAAHVVAAELHDHVRAWCAGPLWACCGGALDDPRVEVRIADVRDVIARAAADPALRFDAIALDLYEGTRPSKGPASADPFFGDVALARTHAALHPSGTLARWTEHPDPAFEQRLERAGFRVERQRIGRGGRRHTLVRGRRRD